MSEQTSPAAGLAEAVARLADAVARLAPCVVLTGSGVSTDSGLPDFRSASGVWRRYDPMEYATIDAFRRDPVKVWDFYGRRLRLLERAEPNEAHRALARLEAAGVVEAVVTQNVDRLHELAGSRNVVEVHGSMRTSSCPRCREVVPFHELGRLLDRHPAPPCPRCGAILKPDVVMFGEAMPEAETARAFELARAARLMLVVGSSLEVYPAAGLPAETLAAGGALAIVNRGTTQYDAEALVTVDAAAAETLAALARELLGPPA